jgi:hypothetical protein
MRSNMFFYLFSIDIIKMSIFIYLPPKYVIGNFAILPILAWDVPKAELQFGAPWFRIEIIPVWEVTESWPLTTENVCIPSQYGYFESFPFHQIFFLFSSARPRDFDGMLGTGLPMSMYTTKTTIDMWRFNIPQLRILNIFCKWQISIKLFYLYQRLQLHRQLLL